MSITTSGTETVVDNATPGPMQMPAIAMNAAGNSVAVWSSGANGGEVLAQRYAAGAPSGGVFQVNQAQAGVNSRPSVAMDSAGDFVVAWNGNASAVYFRDYNASGTAITGDTLVTSKKTGPQASDGIAMTQGGSFMIVWEGADTAADNDGIYAQQFTSAGLATGSLQRLNTTTTGPQQTPAIAVDSAGDYAVVWSDNPNGITTGVYISAATATPSAEFSIGATGTGPQATPAVAFDQAGTYVVTWSQGNPNQGIYARRYSATTALDAAPVLVSTVNAQPQTNPSIAAQSGGGYLIAWTSNGGTGPTAGIGNDGNGKGVFAQAFTSAGAMDGGEFQVNTTTQGDQQDPAAAWNGTSAIIAWDSNAPGPTGQGVYLQQYTTTGPVNQPPANSVPSAAQAVYKNGALTFSSAGGNAISVSDSDADGAMEKITLTATHGTLALSGTTGLTFSSGANISAAMVFTGTLANINAALAGVTFTPASNYTGSAALQIFTNDQGNTGSGGAKTATSSVTINVEAPPTSNTVPAAQTTLENNPLIFSPANGNPIYIGTGWSSVELQAGHGTLTLATKAGLSFSIGNGSSNTTVEFSGSTAAMNAALAGLIFNPTTGYAGSASIALTTTTSGLLGLGLLGSSSSSSIAVAVTMPPPAPDQPPAVRVPGAQTILEGSSLVLSASNAITVSDVDADGGNEQVTLTATSGTLTLAATSGLTFSSGSANTSMTFTGTLASLNSALNGLRFTPAAMFYGSGGISVTIDDLGNTGAGGAQTASASVAINVTEVNQPPALSMPPAQSAAENGTLLFSSSAGNAIAVSDSDDNGAAEQLSLSTTTGTLTLVSMAGITFTTGANGSAAITVTGTLAALNAALNGLSLTPSAGYSGTATLSIGANDLGNSGAGGALGASASVQVTFVSSLTVTTASDVVDGTTTSINALLANPGADGKISLREAIMAANNTAGQHEIDFDIATGGVQTISLATSLTQITNSLIINGATEPGYAGTPLIELNGQSAPFGAIGLSIAASNCTVRGLAVYGFSGNGIDVLPVGANNITIQGNYVGITAAGTAVFNGTGVVLANSSDDLVGGTAPSERNIISGNYSYGLEIFGAGSSNDVVAGNYIGTDPTGATAVGNATAGVYVDGASGNFIGLASPGGGNLISGNGGYGIEVAGTAPANNVIQGNLIGTNAAGTGALGNANDGIYLNGATGTQIGGLTAAARNVISGNDTAANTADGIWIDAGSANVVQGNYIGVDSSGAAALQNYANGVLVQNSPGNQIGGIAAGAGNIISGNGSQGLEITGLSATGNLVEGNYIGTNAAGDAAISNGSDGILLFTTTANTIGGTAAGAGNLISGNTNSANLADGIWIDGGSADVVQANQIGTNAAGNAALGNFNDGIDIEVSANNVIGGISAGAGNVIACNAKGVVIIGSGATGNAIRGNAIYANATLGIDLGDDGVTANTGSLSASLPNNAMNFPVFRSLALTGTSLAVDGYVGIVGSNTAFAGALVDIYKSDQSANGQGVIYLGTLTANGGGNFNGTLSVSGLAAGDQLVATATDSAGNTSEFGPGLTVQLLNAAPTIASPAPQATGENTPIYFSTSRGNGIVIVDADADGGIEQVILSVANGILTLSQTAGLMFQSGSANGASLLNFTGTLADINAALNGMGFSPSQDFFGSTTLSITANDLGNSGAGGPKTTGAAVNLVLNPVAHTPGVTNTTTAIDTQSAGGLVISPDPSDGTALGYYQIMQIVGGALFLSDGVTPVSDGQFITFAQGAAGLKFTPTFNSIATGSFSVQASNSASGGLVGGMVAANITVIGTPIPAYTPTDTNTSTLENHQSSAGLVISPSASDALIPIWFEITHIEGGSLFLNDGITPIQPGEFITAEQGEAGLKFTPAPGSTGAGTFNVQASATSDSSGLGGDVITAAISVSALDRPVNSVPGDQFVQHDAQLTFSRDTANAIVISDPGSDGSAELVDLMAGHGTLSLASTAGITFISGTGTGNASLEFTGTVAAINAALNGLIFVPDANFSGAAELQLVTSDVSVSNGGANLTAQSEIGIEVVPATPTTVPQLPLPSNPPVAVVPPTPPAAAGPVLASAPVSGGGVLNSPPDQATPADDSSPASTPAEAASSSAASTPGEKSRPAAASANIASPSATVVAPILPRQSAPRLGQDDVVALPELPRQADLAAPAISQIALSPIQRLAMELGNPVDENALRIGTLMAPAIHNSYSHNGSAPVALAANSSLWRDLDRMEDQMSTEHKMHVVAGAASLVSVGVSVMYFMWAVRAGSVLSSLLSSMPAWKLVDPLPILDQMAGSRAGKRARESEEDDESLASMVQGASDA